MRIATNSPNRLDPLLVTGLFNLTGSVWLGINMQAPEPQGPGFPKQNPSVKLQCHLAHIFLPCSEQ